MVWKLQLHVVCFVVLGYVHLTFTLHLSTAASSGQTGITDSVKIIKGYLDMAEEGQQVVTSRWTGVGGCAQVFNIIALKEATQSQIKTFFSDTFQSRYSVVIKKDIFSCSMHCGEYNNVERFSFYKGVCQCIYEVHRYDSINVDTKDTTCVNLSGCEDIYYGFCANGKGLPFFIMESDIPYRFNKSIYVPKHNIIPSQCVVQGNETDLKIYNENDCRRMMTRLCEVERIVFMPVSTQYLEWICGSENGIPKIFFRLGSIEMSPPTTILSEVSTEYVSHNQSEIIDLQEDEVQDVKGVIVMNVVLLGLLLLTGVAFIIWKHRRGNKVKGLGSDLEQSVSGHGMTTPALPVSGSVIETPALPAIINMTYQTSSTDVGFHSNSERI